MKRIYLLTALLLTAWVAQAKVYNFAPSDTVEMKRVLSSGSLRPGDEVVLKDGIYNRLGELLFVASGTVQDSIRLRAEHPGRAIVTGGLRMRIYGQYIQIEDLLFHKAWALGTSMIEFRQEPGKEASHCRFTRCVIDDCNDPEKNEKSPRPGEKLANANEYWVGLYGSDIRLDHCYFANKRIGGLVVQVWLSEQCHLNNHQIDHNLFGCRKPYGGNGAEIIRIGHSWSSQLESRTILENNVFLHCDGENEIISVKSCHNVLRRNLFFESRGGLVCRHGHYNVMESNTFVGNDLPGTCGIRIINQGHTVYDNLMCRLGGFGLLVRMGVFERPTPETDIRQEPLTSYHRVENVDIAYNDFIDCKTLEFASGRGEKEPRHVRFAHNNISNPINNVRIFNPERVLPGFCFLDNHYSFGNKERLALGGFFEEMQEAGATGKEETRVLASLKNIGPVWYDNNDKDLTYIKGKYQ